MPARIVLSSGLTGYFTETGRVLNPTDGEYTPTEGESRFIRETGAWLLVPLMAAERLEAFVVFGRQVVPERLTYEDFDLMKIIGRQAVLSLKNFQLAEELTEAREMAAVAKVPSFMLHDLKNLSYTFSLMMENAEEHIVKQEFQRDLIQSIRSTVARVNGLIAKLKAFPARLELHREPVDLARLAGEVLAKVRGLKRSIAFTKFKTISMASGLIRMSLNGWMSSIRPLVKLLPEHRFVQNLKWMVRLKQHRMPSPPGVELQPRRGFNSYSSCAT